jgi:hypothetical protein
MQVNYEKKIVADQVRGGENQLLISPAMQGFI